MLIDFFQRANKLKKTKRFSYSDGLEENTPINESSADHSWRLGLMAFQISKKYKIKLDMEKVYKIVLIHDLAEAITGDYDAYAVSLGKLSKEEKEKEEFKAMQEFAKTDLEMFDLWEDYRESKTEEAKFVKALDKCETLLHFIDCDYNGLDDADFIYTYAFKAVEDFPELKPFYQEVKQEIIKFFKKKGIHNPKIHI